MIDPEDRAAFLAAAAGATPLPPANRAEIPPPRPAPRARQHQADEAPALSESLSQGIGLEDRLEGGDETHYLANGLARQVLRDLRRGRWVIQDAIDLHGHTREEARHALSTFLGECLRRGKRCVRIVHGKGMGSPGRQAVLRHLVRGWLCQHREVLAWCEPPARDGGQGAVWVLLRRSS